MDYILNLTHPKRHFIINQVKFMYGSNFDKMKENKYLYLDKGISVSELMSKKKSFTNESLSNRNNYFIDQLNRYWDKTKDPEDFIVQVDWNDSRSYLEPVISYNRPSDTDVQLLFPLENYHKPNCIFNNDNLLFNEKKNGILWRGATTGYTTLSKNVRCNIVISNFSSYIDIDMGFNALCQGIYANNKELLDKYYKESKTIKEQLDYKFILNIEGNDCASSFPWALTSNSCPLHNYPFSHETYFFGKRLEPYVHFVPIKNDGSDLVLQYHWCLENLEKCEEIANNGKKYMEDYLDPELYDCVIDSFIKIYPFKE